LFIFSTAQSNAALKKYIDNEKNSHDTARSLETILGRPHYFNSRWTPVPVPLSGSGGMVMSVPRAAVSPRGSPSSFAHRQMD
jgi:hypothetical protein